MGYDPVTRTAALVSLVCALMSLAFGCLFIIRFGTMRSMYRASTWAGVSPTRAASMHIAEPLIGGAEDADINPVERMGPPSDPLDMAGLVGNRIHSFDTFVCLEKWGDERPRERWLASSHTHSSPRTSPGNHCPCGPWTPQLSDDSQDIQKVRHR